VAPDLFKLAVGQAAGLVQNPDRHSHLADIVQQARLATYRTSSSLSCNWRASAIIIAHTATECI
jgi:hypothetical protein